MKVGVARQLMTRWSPAGGVPTVDALVSIIARSGGPLTRLDAPRQTEAVRRFEADYSDAFAALRRIVYLSYYQAPAVIEAIARSGHDYRLAPQPEGYALRRFDAEEDGPSHRRGAYLATADIRRVDLKNLDHLGRGTSGA